MKLKPSLDWLLIFVPLAVCLEFFTSDKGTWIFICSCLAIIPLAGWMGKATEHLAERTGDGIGGLLNATFGNAAELIIALMAMSQGQYVIVKASITGSIVGNILLILGASFITGGLKRETLKFNATGARVQSTMLIIAAFALVCPALYHGLAGSGADISGEDNMSVYICIVLFVVYLLGLLFSLKTHKKLFAGHQAHKEDNTDGHESWSLGRSFGVLFGATAVIALMSEFLVGSVEHAAESLGITPLFVGVVVVAVVGNAAEHSTAVLMAAKNRMDLTITIAVGSSIQIALFVAPILVFASYLIGPHPMNLVFEPAEVMAVIASVLIVSQIADDGESNWLEGAQLIAAYLILAILFYFLPASV